MTDPKENEEINEELSTEELKSVSGGGVAEVADNYIESMEGIIDSISCETSGFGEMSKASVEVVSIEQRSIVRTAGPSKTRGMREEKRRGSR